jgi:hypothetical protein
MLLNPGVQQDIPDMISGCVLRRKSEPDMTMR